MTTPVTRYASTQVGQYLAERFKFAFLDQAPFQRLEDHIWEVARRAMVARKEAHATAEALTRDAQYVMTSSMKPDANVYEPLSRASLKDLVRETNDLEREVQDLLNVHAATVEAFRAIRMDLPTVAEHSEALGRVRELEQHLIGTRQQVTELLAAREEWDKTEAQLASDLAEAREELRTHDAAATKARAELAGVLGRAEALQERLNDALRRVSVLTEQRIELERRVSDLNEKLAAETKAAEDFADERDDAQRDASYEKERADRLESELDDAKERLDNARTELQEVRDALRDAEYKATDQQNRAEELEAEVTALEKANQAR